MSAERVQNIIKRLLEKEDPNLIKTVELAIAQYDAPDEGIIREISLSQLADYEWGKTSALSYSIKEISHNASTWRKVYIGIIEFLVKENCILEKDLPLSDYYGNSRFFANRTAINSSGKGFTDPELIKGIYSECHYNTSMKAKNLIKIIEKCKGLQVEDFKVRVKS